VTSFRSEQKDKENERKKEEDPPSFHSFFTATPACSPSHSQLAQHRKSFCSLFPACSTTIVVSLSGPIGAES
jgi:hypothetical protein